MLQGAIDPFSSSFGSTKNTRENSLLAWRFQVELAFFIWGNNKFLGSNNFINGTFLVIKISFQGSTRLFHD